MPSTVLRSRVGGLLVLTVCFLAPAARADVDDYNGNYVPDASTRRFGFTMGTHLGAALGDATGYPNEVAKIDQPEFEASTGLGAGPGGAIWLGATLRDWFTFGVGVHHSQVAANSLSSRATTFGVHIEGFPLFYQGPVLENFGVFGEFGAGSRNVYDENDETVGEGGSMSFVGAGAFWEGLRLGSHVSTGPMLQITHMFSQTLTSTIGLVGFRAAYYAGP